MIELSEKTIEIINVLFLYNDRKQVEELLKMECAENVFFCENMNPFEMERIRFSVLKLSQGEISKLLDAIELAQTDWRDLFMAAGFGDLNSYKQWNPIKTNQLDD